MMKEPVASRIPDFSTRAEEAAWFDAHDMSDYLDEFTILDRSEIVVSLPKRVESEPSIP